MELISYSLAFLFHLLYQTSLQSYLRLLNARWHKDSSKAKQHEAMAFEKVSYAGHCSPIYREDEPPLYKITIMTPRFYTHCLQMISKHQCIFSFLRYACLGLSRVRASSPLTLEAHLLFRSERLRLAPLLLPRTCESSLYVIWTEGQLCPLIGVYLKHTCLCRSEG
jgi:hypothetical protein